MTVTTQILRPVSSFDGGKRAARFPHVSLQPPMQLGYVPACFKPRRLLSDRSHRAFAVSPFSEELTMTKRVAILQSNYIPWKGYFDLIAAVDEFILYDDMQYTRRDWRNRNQIKTPHGLQWLTVPVVVKGRYHQKIRETEIDGAGWAADHWKALEQNYRRAPHFGAIAAWLRPLYLERTYASLSQLNRALLTGVCGYLGIRIAITTSSDYPQEEGKTERLAGLCAMAGGVEYVSGPSARDYIDVRVFAARGIQLTWFDYLGYAPYPQLWGEFVHGVTILDLLFNCGPDALRYLRYVRP